VDARTIIDHEATAKGSVMRRIIVCDGVQTARLWTRIDSVDHEELTWVPRKEESALRPSGFRVLQGGLSVDAISKLEPKVGEGFALASDDGSWVRTAIALIVKVAPEAPILLLSNNLGEDDLPDHPCLRRAGMATLLRDDIDFEFDHLENLRRVVELRDLLGPREKVAVLLQPDPDPDGIACGYALRVILGRKKTTAPLVSFGKVKRPENQALVKALGIDIETITPDELEEYDGLILVDVQPNVFGDEPPPRLRSVDAVIDHHPERTGYDSVIKDIRSSYGATATILTQYLRAAAIKIGPRLATALLYGIKSDTQLLGRETSPHDMVAFAHLHASYSPALLRRIERPALPLDGLRALGRALIHANVEDGIHILVLGRVREDVIPQVADMGLQAEGAEWAIAAGIVGSNLVFSVRNVGYVRAAGEVVRAVVEDLGVGGGHRSMAKGIIPLKAFRKVYKKADRKTIQVALHESFIAAIHGENN
jgi:nanoRNase/pAp phosphatase (c-di-AMP/oligoRNAs hydrolase)